ncbi:MULTISPECIES: transporter [unclassified Polaribacter]|uniref:transporter n=1 Tax=unclassified Polaribacter TaxID=196858 RepID=UPI0011BDA6AE|nr:MULTISPECIES: transporter [unclassified Polaribacter]TXD52990.1 transporter [Polaribacter sp. IC063]TXD60918.1 transporter [Polaribacter sp. IC066]
MIKKILFIFLMLLATVAKAQFTETLASDRPGQALSANTVGKNVFQTQAGIDFFDSTSYFYPNSFFRYGFSEKFELNTGFILSGSSFERDLESFTIGARYLLSNLDSKSKSSVQLSYDFGAVHKNTQLTYIYGNSFSEKLSYTVNLGMNIDDTFEVNNALYVLNLAYALNNKMGVFIESFGTFLNDAAQVNFDAGYYYLLNNNVQFDFLIGENDGLFLGAGVTWRIPPISKK